MKALATVVALSVSLVASAATAADSSGYKKAYFEATVPGSWAQYTFKTEGQADMDYKNTRLTDAGGSQRVEVSVEYVMQGKVNTSFSAYTLKSGYSLQTDALGFGKAVTGMSIRQPGKPATEMPAATLDVVRKSFSGSSAAHIINGLLYRGLPGKFVGMAVQRVQVLR